VTRFSTIQVLEPQYLKKPVQKMFNYSELQFV